MKKFFSSYISKCWTIALPLLFLIVITPPILVLGYPTVAWVIGTFGTALILLGNIVYIVFYDSQKRWPHLNAFDRFARAITFGR